MKASKIGFGGARKIVVGASVLVLSIVMGAPMVLAQWGGGSPTFVETTYGGRAYGVGVLTPLADTYFADTGTLPSSGGALFADFTPVDTDLAEATVLLSYTRGFSDLAVSEPASSDVTLLTGTAFEVGASFVYAASAAACDGAWGSSEIYDLTIGGISYGVSGAPNEVIYSIPGVFTLVANEQVDSSWGTTKSITVNALHAWLYEVEVIVSSAYSSVTCPDSGGIFLGEEGSTLGTRGLSAGDVVYPMCGYPGCGGHLHDFVTGGGFFEPPNCVTRPNPCERVNFGFNAGSRPGNDELKGHLNLIDHTYGDHVSGVSVDFYEPLAEDPENCRRFGGDAKFNGVPGFFYATLVCDYGEPGRDDHFAICVTTAPNCGGVEVYFADNYDGTPWPEGGELDGGNIQLHRFK